MLGSVMGSIFGSFSNDSWMFGVQSTESGLVACATSGVNVVDFCLDVEDFSVNVEDFSVNASDFSVNSSDFSVNASDFSAKVFDR